MMQILAPVESIRFDIEEALDKQTFASLQLPFPGIDKSSAAICEFFMRSQCSKGNFCPFRHIRGDKSVLCKHWLRGLCKKGDECEFLHEYDMSKMPECFFYSKFAQCGNKECEFLHLDPEAKIKDCPWYDRGFCRHGPLCKNRHNRKVLCKNYLCGFCPEGPLCKFKHPKFDLPTPDIMNQQKKQLFLCDYCGEYGHKMTSCFKLNPENRIAYQMKLQQQSQNRQQQQQQQQNHDGEQSNQPHHHQQQQQHQPQQHQQQRRYNYNYSSNYSTGGMTHPEVTCFKCGEKGHYANRCNKSAFAFLRGPTGGDQQK